MKHPAYEFLTLVLEEENVFQLEPVYRDEEPNPVPNLYGLRPGEAEQFVDGDPPGRDLPEIPVFIRCRLCRCGKAHLTFTLVDGSVIWIDGKPGEPLRFREDTPASPHRERWSRIRGEVHLGTIPERFQQLFPVA